MTFVVINFLAGISFALIFTQYAEQKGFIRNDYRHRNWRLRSLRFWSVVVMAFVPGVNLLISLSVTCCIVRELMFPEIPYYKFTYRGTRHARRWKNI